MPSTPARIEFRADLCGINELANGPEMHALLRPRAEAGARWDRANAPVETRVYRALPIHLGATSNNNLASKTI